MTPSSVIPEMSREVTLGGLVGIAMERGAAAGGVTEMGATVATSGDSCVGLAGVQAVMKRAASAEV